MYFGPKSRKSESVKGIFEGSGGCSSVSTFIVPIFSAPYVGLVRDSQGCLLSSSLSCRVPSSRCLNYRTYQTILLVGISLESEKKMMATRNQRFAVFVASSELVQNPRFKTMQEIVDWQMARLKAHNPAFDPVCDETPSHLGIFVFEDDCIDDGHCDIPKTINTR